MNDIYKRRALFKALCDGTKLTIKDNTGNNKANVLVQAVGQTQYMYVESGIASWANICDILDMYSREGEITKVDETDVDHNGILT